MKRSFLVPLVLLAAPFAVAQEAEKEQAAPKSVPAELQKALANAEMHNKRVLVIGCAEGVDLQASLKRAPKLSRKILYEFEVVQFAGGRESSQWTLEDGGAALTLLAADGKQLQQLAAEDYGVGSDVRADELLARWQPHFCAPVDAQKKLDDAFALAKKTGRNVFVRFDAPW